MNQIEFSYRSGQRHELYVLYEDGLVFYTETAYQHSLDGSPAQCAQPPWTAPARSVSFIYDADGNALTETHHICSPTAGSCPADVRKKWYDGAGRLVEVSQPHDDQYDLYTFPWMTRYIYDVTNGTTVSMGGGSRNFDA